ncbi:MAG: hypothetical protein RSB57_10735, partial [Hungatella sp.]
MQLWLASGKLRLLKD